MSEENGGSVTLRAADVEFIVFATELQEEMVVIIDDENSTQKQVKQAVRALKYIARDIRRAAKGDAALGEDDASRSDASNEEPFIPCNQCYSTVYTPCVSAGTPVPTCQTRYRTCMNSCT